MEKRMILAFVLAFLILMLWSFVFAPKQDEAPQVEDAQHKKSEKSVSETRKSSPLKPAISPETIKKQDRLTIPTLREKEVTIETPLYKATFSSVGAMIKSYKLKEFYLTTKSDSPLIELANLGETGDNFLYLTFEDDSKPTHEKIIYQVSEESLILDPGSSPRDLTFRSTTSDGVTTTQTFRFYPDRYNVDLLIRLENNSEKQVEGKLEARLANLPDTGKKSYYSFVGVALLLNDELEQIKPKKMKDGKFLSGPIGWVAFEDEYFITAVIPEDHAEGSFQGQSLPSGILKATYMAPSISLNSSEHNISHFTLYLGPRDLYILKALNKKLEKAIDYGMWDIIAKPLLITLRFFNRYISNYGVSILLLTILIKILFWPLAHKQYKSMKGMQKLQPLMAKIREKYKEDKQQMNKELMGLYKTYKINPMGGCLPLVVQIPVFFALFRVLSNSIELRHAPFLFWIKDLSAPDRLFNFPFQIPFMSAPYGIPVLTLLMGASMFLQQKMTPMAGDPTQAKIMMFLPLIFTVMFINFPSGLVLYWLTQNILSIGQQYFMLRRSA
jgi:YidC/Oxa1 family membrane protein insertase